MLETFLGLSSEYLLFFASAAIMLGSIWLTFKTRFVQIRLFPQIFKMFLLSRGASSGICNHTISPSKALFTAMSTTLGIGTIVAPIIAVNLGGPGALVGFLFTAFFGSAATYVEVNLSIKYRKKLQDGTIMGGPMQYLKQIISPRAASAYALFCFILMIFWSGAQSNQVAAILDSPLLGDFRIPKIVSGAFIASIIIFLLMGGIKRISEFSAKLVPGMFVLYLGTSFWILLSNIDKFGFVFGQMWDGLFSPYEMGTGAIVGGAVGALRWGVFKGIHVTEAGVGTQAIPHSMAATSLSDDQGALAMLSTYTAGLLSFLSGSIALMTGTWQDPSIPLGIGMVAASFNLYFSSLGTAIIAFIALLFGFGTILGNSYNGSQCFNYLTENRGTWYFFFGTALMVFIGAISEVTSFWGLTDFLLAFMVLLHMTGLVISVQKQEEPSRANIA